MTDQALRLALELPATALGANNRLHAGTCIAHGIEAIVSTDQDFDELQAPGRVDPLDRARLDALLGAG